MKVIHLTSGGDVGGAKTHVLSVVRGLNQTERAELVCFTEGAFAQEARALGIPTTVMDGGVLSTLGRLARRIRDEGYDLVHCHGARANMYGALLGRRLAVPVVTTVHSDPRLDYMGRPLRNLVNGSINRLALRRMSYLIGVSDVMSELLIGRGFDPQGVYTLYNGVEFTPQRPTVPRAEFLRRLGVAFDEKTVIFGIAARISPVKDLSTLIRAFSGAVQRVPNIRLIIAGDGEQADEIRALAASTCPKGSVYFVGWLEDTDSFYEALDVNLLTSVSETFPYALTEGAKHRCATIASRVGGVPHLIDDEINGLIFPAQNAGQLADDMVRLAGDRALRERFGNRLYEKTRQKFSVEATVERQKEIYRSILRRQDRLGRKRDGVMICGAYGRKNAGDEGILEAVTCALRKDDPELPICVISRRPMETKMQFRVDACHSFDVFAWLRMMRKTALYLSGGGSLIQDVTSSRSLLYYMYHLRAAKRRGAAVMLYGCGVGPVRQEKNRRLAGKLLNRYVDCIALRDSGSVEELKRLGVTRPPVYLTADPALLLPPPEPDFEAAWLLSQGFSAEKDYFMVALRPWEGIEEKLPIIKTQIERIAAERGCEPVLFALEPGRDRPLLDRFAATLSCPVRVVSAPERWDALISLIRRMQAVVSMRLHPLVFAAGQGIPVAGISYDPKVRGFLADLGGADCCEIGELDETRAAELFDSVFTAQSADVAALRARAERNAELARQLLEKMKK